MRQQNYTALKNCHKISMTLSRKSAAAYDFSYEMKPCSSRSGKCQRWQAVIYDT